MSTTSRGAFAWIATGVVLLTGCGAGSTESEGRSAPPSVPATSSAPLSSAVAPTTGKWRRVFDVRLPHPVSVEDAVSMRDTVEIAALNWGMGSAGGGVGVGRDTSVTEIRKVFDEATRRFGRPPVSGISVVEYFDAPGRPSPEETRRRMEKVVKKVTARAMSLPKAEAPR